MYDDPLSPLSMHYMACNGFYLLLFASLPLFLVCVGAMCSEQIGTLIAYFTYVCM